MVKGASVLSNIPYERSNPVDVNKDVISLTDLQMETNRCIVNTTQIQNFGGDLPIADPQNLKPVLFRVSVPVGNCYRVTRKLSCSNKVFDNFLEISRLKLLQKKILQGGQLFCRSSFKELLQGKYKPWHDSPVYI